MTDGKLEDPVEPYLCGDGNGTIDSSLYERGNDGKRKGNLMIRGPSRRGPWTPRSRTKYNGRFIILFGRLNQEPFCRRYRNWIPPLPLDRQHSTDHCATPMSSFCFRFCGLCGWGRMGALALGLFDVDACTLSATGKILRQQQAASYFIRYRFGI